MRTKRVTRYHADCGKGYWKKEYALNHEKVCKCWTNPANKACKTCIYGGYYPGDNETGESAYWECGHIKVDEHISGINGVDYISVNCKYYK